jgi:hypothetical protein
MSATKDTHARDSVAAQFTALDRATWQRCESALLGMIGEKHAKMPMMLSVENYIAHKLERLKPVGVHKIEALTMSSEDEWYAANDTIHNVLSVAMRNCAGARTILSKYAAGLVTTVDEIGDAANA